MLVYLFCVAASSPTAAAALPAALAAAAAAAASLREALPPTLPRFARPSEIECRGPVEHQMGGGMDGAGITCKHYLRGVYELCV